MDGINWAAYVKIYQYLIPKKFCFVLSLKTGIQFYSLSSFIIGVLITDMLLINLIDQQPRQCRAYHSPVDLLRCVDGDRPNCLDNEGTDVLRILATKQMIYLHISLAVLSALVLYFLKWPAMPLFWSGAKAITGFTELCYLPEFGQDILQLFNFSIHPNCIAVIFTILDIYGILIALGYYEELVSRNHTKYEETNVNFPDPPNCDITLGTL